MARTNLISGIAGVATAVAVFVVLQAWTPPEFVLGLVDAKTTRAPREGPEHKLAVRTEPPVAGAPAIVTEADVVDARSGPVPADGVATVTLQLGGAGRARLANYASSHPTETLAVTVDNAVIYTKPATAFAAGAAATIDLVARPPLEDNAMRLVARFGGTVKPPPAWALAAARLIPAFVAGFLVLALVRLLTGR